MRFRALLLACLTGSFWAGCLWGQGVTFDRLLHADKEPQNWLTYSGTVNGQRYSPLTQVTPANVKNLELQWVWQARSIEKFETTALVVDGVLYTIQAPNDVYALDAHLLAIDAATGKIVWNTTVGSAADRYAITHAPLIVKDKVIVGLAGGD